jgi:hypothetical protein
MISALPGRNMRPATSCTWGRSARPAAEVPRMVRLPALALSFLGRALSTTVSALARRWPSAPRAMPGRLARTAAWLRSTPLLISEGEPLRRAMTLSGRPVATRVARMPSLIISTVAKV